MSKPRGFSFPAFYVTVIAFLALIAFLYTGDFFLLFLIPIVIYFIWDLRKRMKDIEKRLDEQQAKGSTQA